MKLTLCLLTFLMAGLSACHEDDSSTLGDCLNGEQKCARNSVYLCVDGQWEIDQLCQSTQTCNTTLFTCEVLACNNGNKRCENNNVEVCSAGLWVIQAQCEGKSICNVVNFSCETPTPVCTDGDKRCTPIGSAIDICKEGAWTRETTCTELEVCNPETKTCDTTMGPCEGAKKQCSNNIVFACVENIWTSETACKGKTPTCNDGACVECTDNTHCFNSTCDTTTHKCRPIVTISWCQSKLIDLGNRSSIGDVRDPRKPTDSTTITANIRCGIAGQRLSEYKVIKGSYWMTNPVFNNQLLYTAGLNSLTRGQYLCLWTFALPGGKTVACPPNGGVLTDFSLRPTKFLALEYTAL